MENAVYLTKLYDYYQPLLTDKQREYFEDYYFDNLTINEIAENNQVSKAVVSKTLIEVKEKLEDFESKMKLSQNSQKIKEILSDEEYQKIEELI